MQKKLSYFVLQRHPVAQGAQVVAQVNVAGRLHAAKIRLDIRSLAYREAVTLADPGIIDSKQYPWYWAQDRAEEADINQHHQDNETKTAPSWPVSG